LLRDFGFYRVHKSYLINLAHIHRFEKAEGGNVILTGDSRVPVASRKREELLKLFEHISE
jgi:two-component system LytT family response regulator